MKLAITDKFLLDIYTIWGNAEAPINSMFRRRKLGQTLFEPKNPIIEKYQKEINARNFAKLIYYLKRKNYIKVSNLQNKRAIILTKEGINKALRSSFIMEGKVKRRDGKWIMLIFDIPEKYRKSRSLLRSILYDLGYKIYQHSVWITPYDVSEKTEKLLQIYSLDKYVKIFLIEEI